MSKSSAASSCSRSGPGTPNYLPKGWSSERGKYGANTAVLLPLGNGRQLPSKWEDAERWILSPVSAENAGRLSARPPHHRRPKSKSGPLGHPSGFGGARSSSASPSGPCFDTVLMENLAAGSPFMAGILMPQRGGNCGRPCNAAGESCVARSASVHGWLDMLIESSSSLPSSQDTVQDERTENSVAVAAANSPLTSKKNVATQMSPEGSAPSSPGENPSFSHSPSNYRIEELGSRFAKLEIKDVQVDDHVTITRWSRKHSMRNSENRPTNIIDYWRRQSAESKDSSSEVNETAKDRSKLKREEAKIAAWENLQKAKAETAILKLEMKLEKERSSSMEKILIKLRSAEKKAKEMRNAASANQAQDISQTPRKASYFRRDGQIRSLRSCFTCRAF
ncbi:uncharacterized protein LOC109711260 [Ananas comosus]|uniref:Uncharacterized protein LOC109711260 n=1 Tax=Ananas comosus TaxID=4615 RepID=A0A6P5F8I9_ANACO|nr:uncharacterized protein LOC109711260 [Ananas comosus]